MSQALYAIAISGGTRIDRQAGIIRGVSVFQTGLIGDRGLHADNGTLTRLKALGETYANGVKVKADHGSGIFDVSGVLRNFRIDGGTLRADLHILKSEENSEKLMEMAEEIPDTFGLSVSIEQELEQVGDRLFIRPTSLFSVDLVTDPAACPSGLFSTRRIDATTKIKPMNPEDMLKEFNAIKAAIAGFESRLAKFECAPGTDKEEMGKKIAGFEAALKETRESFEKKLTEATDVVVTKVAAEFSKTIGTVTVKASEVDGSKKEAKDEPKPEAGFVAKVQAEFAKNGGSKTKALAAAIAADKAETQGKGYSAFISSGKAINYQKA